MEYFEFIVDGASVDSCKYEISGCEVVEEARMLLVSSLENFEVIVPRLFMGDLEIVV
jgi:hypothetical protein